MSYVKQDWIDGESTSTTTDSAEVTGSTAYALHVSTTGSPTSGAALLEGSVDGTNWSELASVNVALAGSGPQIVWVANKPVKLIRARMTSLGGGTSPTLSASVLAV